MVDDAGLSVAETESRGGVAVDESVVYAEVPRALVTAEACIGVDAGDGELLLEGALRVVGQGVVRERLAAAPELVVAVVVRELRSQKGVVVVRPAV